MGTGPALSHVDEGQEDEEGFPLEIRLDSGANHGHVTQAGVSVPVVDELENAAELKIVGEKPIVIGLHQVLLGGPSPEIAFRRGNLPPGDADDVLRAGLHELADIELRPDAPGRARGIGSILRIAVSQPEEEPQAFCHLLIETEAHSHGGVILRPSSRLFNPAPRAIKGPPQSVVPRATEQLGGDAHFDGPKDIFKYAVGRICVVVRFLGHAHHLKIEPI